jgi:hypothetical protein
MNRRGMSSSPAAQSATILGQTVPRTAIPVDIKREISLEAEVPLWKKSSEDLNFEDAEINHQMLV